MAQAASIPSALHSSYPSSNKTAHCRAARRRRSAALLAGATLLASIAICFQTGCQSSQHGQASAHQRHSQLAHKGAPPATNPVAHGRISGDQGPGQDDASSNPGNSSTATALAMKARDYAQSMTPLLEQKLRPATNPSNTGANRPNNPPAGESVATPPVSNTPAQAPEPSAVEWSPTQGIRGGLLGALLSPKTHNEGPMTPAVTASASVQPIIDNVVAGGAGGNPGDASGNSAGADSLGTRITQRAKDYPKEVWAQLDYQLLQFLEDQPAPKIEELSDLPTEDRELLTAVIDGLSNFRNALRADNNMLPSKKVKPILELADRLRAQADLSIPTLCLCTRVDGFGVYEPIEPLRFEAGKDHQALIYCEIENFASQINEKKLWETKLSQEASLFTETGMLVWHDDAKPMTDEARNRRHDFYIVKRIKLPSNLTIGRYLLKVTIVDQQASRVAEATLPIQIVAQP